MDTLYNGINHSYDKIKLQWLYDNYNDKNIADYIKIRISGFLGKIELRETTESVRRLEYIEKAISQDLKI